MSNATRIATCALIHALGLLSLCPQLALAQASGGSDAAAQAAPKLTRPPELLKFVEAPYPEAERASGKSAAVVLQLTISATGTVDDVTVNESAGPAFDAAALAAAKQFVFR